MYGNQIDFTEKLYFDENPGSYISYEGQKSLMQTEHTHAHDLTANFPVLIFLLWLC